MDSKYFIAFDLGATSGRTILGTLTGDKLTLEEVTRFPNQMLQPSPISTSPIIAALSAKNVSLPIFGVKPLTDFIIAMFI